MQVVVWLAAFDRARNEVEVIKQKPRERFDEYRMRFEDLLARSDSMDLPDREKIILIQRGLRRDFDRQCAVAGIPKRDYAGAVAKWQTVADGTEDCDLRDKTWGRAAYTTPLQRDTDGDVQMTGVNATGFTNKKSKKTGNASAKAGTAVKWVSQAVLAQRREAGRARRPEFVFAMSPRRRRKTPTATIRKKTSPRLKTRRRGQ
ncbi:hypothetical protein E4U36_005352 [Claviceps purpurea]|nr:hypothetical protein E4U36_005352 [Claviceps purpurea]